MTHEEMAASCACTCSDDCENFVCRKCMLSVLRFAAAQARREAFEKAAKLAEDMWNYQERSVNDIVAALRAKAKEQ